MDRKIPALKREIPLLVHPTCKLQVELASSAAQSLCKFLSVSRKTPSNPPAYSIKTRLSFAQVDRASPLRRCNVADPFSTTHRSHLACAAVPVAVPHLGSGIHHPNVRRSLVLDSR